MVRAIPVRTRRADLPRTIVEQSTDNVVGELPDELVDWDSAVTIDQEY
jgi:hypothetical protein